MQGSERGRVLVVDDNRLNRLTLSRAIERHGHNVEEAEDGRIALRKIRDHDFDVIILDIVMPEIDGHQVLEELKGDISVRDIPVIVVSAVDDIESIVRCIELGAEDYLTKPFNPVILKARLDTSLSKKRHRDLERAYLQQELMLRENEKLATLGRLSAGMAHELNNPAAAARSGARQIGSSFARIQSDYFGLLESDLPSTQVRELRLLDEQARASVGAHDGLDALTRSDREIGYEQVLSEMGVEEPWRHVSELAYLAVEPVELRSRLRDFSATQLSRVIPWLGDTISIYRLNEDIQSSLERVTAIVTALKSYSHMDQAPVQDVDIHVGLNSTLSMLNDRIGDQVEVVRDYADDLPRIEAFGSELNQVWTNLLNNALDALHGVGVIRIRTFRQGHWVVAQIEDSGGGITEEDQARVFDPFFTTKPPGHGTGLGLSVSHNIVVVKHSGEISVTSQPGSTVFEVRLPLESTAREA